LLPVEFVSNRCHGCPSCLPVSRGGGSPADGQRPAQRCGQSDGRSPCRSYCASCRPASQDPRRDPHRTGVWLELLDDRNRRDLVTLPAAPPAGQSTVASPFSLLQSWPGGHACSIELGELLRPISPARALLLKTLLDLLHEARAAPLVDVASGGFTDPAADPGPDRPGLGRRLAQATATGRRRPWAQLRSCLPLSRGHGHRCGYRPCSAPTTAPGINLAAWPTRREPFAAGDLGASPSKPAFLGAVDAWSGRKAPPQLRWHAEGLSHSAAAGALMEAPRAVMNHGAGATRWLRPPPGAEKTIRIDSADVRRCWPPKPRDRAGAGVRILVVCYGHSLGAYPR